MEKLIHRVADTQTDIEILTERIEALEVILCSLLAEMPNNEGLRLLAKLTRSFECQSHRPALIAEFEQLSAIVSSFRA